MLKKIVKLVANGISWGCTVGCLISIVGVAIHGNDWFLNLPKGFIAQAVASIIVGIGFSTPSIIYSNEKLSLLQQWLVYMVLGFVIFLPTAFYMQWMPIQNPIMVIVGIASAIIISLIIWFCFYLYYRSEAKVINKEIKDKK